MGLNIISPPGAGGGGGGANLTRTLAASQVTINSDTGTDAIIPAADGTNAGVMTSELQVKLAGVETAADVTDAGNVGSSIHGATAKTTPVDADTVALIDSAASNVLKKVTWANIKATLKAYLDTLYATIAQANATHTGDATGATALTLATVNSNVGSFTNANITVNAKGLITAASSGSSGGTIATPRVYYVETTGNDGTGGVGNPALPYATGTAAYNAGVTAGFNFTIKFGVGPHTITRTADSSPYFIQAIGCGRDATTLTLNGYPADASTGVAGYSTTLNISHLYLYVIAIGSAATGNSGEAGGQGGSLTLQGDNCIVDVANLSGGNSADGDGGVGGYLTLSGDIKLVSVTSYGGSPGGAGSPGAGGHIPSADGCYLVGCTYNGVTAGVFARCSYTAADITPSSALACAAY